MQTNSNDKSASEKPLIWIWGVIMSLFIFPHISMIILGLIELFSQIFSLNAFASDAIVALLCFSLSLIGCCFFCLGTVVCICTFFFIKRNITLIKGTLILYSIVLMFTSIFTIWWQVTRGNFEVN
jgi:hypothetical protein